MKKSSKTKSSNGANLGFEQKLWQAADKLRSNMDAAEYKHVVLGLIFLKYISDAFKDHRAMIEREASNPGSEWYVFFLGPFKIHKFHLPIFILEARNRGT